MKNLLFAVALLVVTSVSAQSYISVSGGYAIPSAGVKFGEEITLNGHENSYGSYGEGLNSQLRFGHFFNDTFGLEFGFGYLHGSDQVVSSVSGVPGLPEVDVKARGRAYGLSTSVVYNFNENLYGRFGALIKLGGKTEVIGSIEGLTIAAGSLPGLPIETNLDVDFVQDYKGRLPLGFVAAMGYKRSIGKNLNLFAELEYMGISVTRNTSEMMEFSATLQEVPGSEIGIDTVKAILAAGGSSLAPLFNQDIEYVDELPLGHDKNGTKQLSQTVPYSSFGINFGITYTFGSSSKE